MINPTTDATASIATINIGVLETPQARDYFSKADHRIMCGCRATLEMLGIPLPDWARRKPTGPKPGRAIAAAFRADNPETLYEATLRRSRERTDRLPSLTDRHAKVRAIQLDAAVMPAIPATEQAYSTAYPDDPDRDPLSF